MQQLPYIPVYMCYPARCAPPHFELLKMYFKITFKRMIRYLHVMISCLLYTLKSPYLDQMTSFISKTSKFPYIKVSNKYLADSLQTELGSIVVNIVKYQENKCFFLVATVRSILVRF